MPAAGRSTAKTKIFQLKVTLMDVDPPVWRRVLVPGEMTLGELHDVVQVTMGWSDDHLHEFEVDGVRYGVADREWGSDGIEPEGRARLFRVAHEGSSFVYRYDLGDDWRHEITVEQVLPPAAGARYPACIDGGRACPPEDVGGPWSYPEFLAALADASHPEHEQWTEWIGDGFDADRFDRSRADAVLARMAWRTG